MFQPSNSDTAVVDVIFVRSLEQALVLLGTTLVMMPTLNVLPRQLAAICANLAYW